MAGSTGLVGSAIYDSFLKREYEVIGINRSVVDLQKEAVTNEFLLDPNPNL